MRAMSLLDPIKGPIIKELVVSITISQVKVKQAMNVIFIHCGCPKGKRFNIWESLILVIIGMIDFL